MEAMRSAVKIASASPRAAAAAATLAAEAAAMADAVSASAKRPNALEAAPASGPGVSVELDTSKLPSVQAPSGPGESVPVIRVAPEGGRNGRPESIPEISWSSLSWINGNSDGKYATRAARASTRV
jgi:hypothetical protein